MNCIFILFFVFFVVVVVCLWCLYSLGTDTRDENSSCGTIRRWWREFFFRRYFQWKLCSRTRAL